MIKSNIVIVGGGFGGVKAALEIAKRSNKRVLLISDKPDMQYYPTLFAAATGRSRTPSWIPLGSILAEYETVDVFIDTIEKIDADKRQIRGKSGEIYEYQTCILALGSVTTYFGIPGMEQYAMGIKSSAEIHRLKQSIYEDIAEHGQLDAHYVIVGGGPTGVELAGSLQQYIRRVCRRHGLKKTACDITLIEATPRLLPHSHTSTSRRAERRLKRLGVKVYLSNKVESVSSKSLVMNDTPLETHSIIWTSGVATHPLYAAHPKIFQLATNGRVEVDQHIQAYPHIFVIGDNANTKYSGMAQTALYDAAYIARYLTHDEYRPYVPRLPFSIVPIGERYAVMERGWLRLSGWPAAVLRSLSELIGFRDLMSTRKAVALWLLASTSDDDYFTP